ncbi:MAG: hypothetical protein KDD47_10445 [Acidobacteria bacterium]|nr:hypothetical protein [Acidobacteriota bacterium]
MKRRLLVLALVLCAGGTAAYFVGIPEAGALPPNEVEIFYYSDASLTQEVGWFFRACDGSRLEDGTRSPYMRSIKGAACSSGGGSCFICVQEGVGRVHCPGTAAFHGYPLCPGEPG